MLKSALFVLTILFSQLVASAECIDANGEDIYSRPEIFSVLIENSETCYEAKQLAEACAYGSSLDAMTAGLAYGVCESELQAQDPSQELVKLLTKMEGLCADKYEQMDGTMYISMNAFCYLSSIEWILNIATPN